MYYIFVLSWSSWKLSKDKIHILFIPISHKSRVTLYGVVLWQLWFVTLKQASASASARENERNEAGRPTGPFRVGWIIEPTRHNPGYSNSAGGATTVTRMKGLKPVVPPKRGGVIKRVLFNDIFTSSNEWTNLPHDDKLFILYICSSYKLYNHNFICT